jgi:integrase
MKKRKNNRFPGVTPLGDGRYRLRTKLIHPKTGKACEIDRVVEAVDERAAASQLASERAAWLSKRDSAAAEAGPRRLGDALDTWLADKRSTVKASTASTYSSAVTWWKAVLGDHFLHKLDPSDVREALDGWRDAGDASETIDGRLRVLRTFAREERCPSIVEGVTVKRDVREDERIEDEGRGLTIDELRRFLADGPRAWLMKNGDIHRAWRRAWALVATMAWTGIRFGEASALEWKDVDLDAGTIRVRRAQWRGKLGHVKAKASKRTVVIPDELGELLHEHRRAMVAKQQHGVDSPLVFPSRRRVGSGFVTNTHARKAIERVLTKAKIALDGRPTVHMLRHTWNNLVRQNASELVRRALIGHADDESGERYSSVGMDERRAALAGVVRMLKGGE